MGSNRTHLEGINPIGNRHWMGHHSSREVLGHDNVNEPSGLSDFDLDLVDMLCEDGEWEGSEVDRDSNEDVIISPPLKSKPGADVQEMTTVETDDTEFEIQEELNARILEDFGALVHDGYEEKPSALATRRFTPPPCRSRCASDAYQGMNSRFVTLSDGQSRLVQEDSHQYSQNSDILVAEVWEV